MADRRLRRHLSQDEMNRGIGMLHSGLSQRHVANVLGVSQSVVSRMWNRFITTGNVRHLHAGGRERSTNEVQDRFLVVQARRHRFDNATTLRRDFQNATGVRISTQTIRNRLHDAGLRSKRPAIRVPLTRYHVQMRLAWARDHVTWTQNDWAPVLFTDESRFCVDFTNRRARVWRMPNERFAPVCVAEHDRFGGGSVMVWAGISAQGKTDLHVIDNGTLTALRYVNEILDVYVRPYAGAVGENFILMDDNARAHRARITDQYLEQVTIVLMEWPARSPDLNPIEHAWDMLQTAVSSRPVQPGSVQELRQALLEEWDQIPQYKIRRLISSMRRRCQAVIEARGHHTRY